MKILLHACCAPCLAGTLPAFAHLGEALPYFYNPNIHPLLEFRKRLKAMDVLAERRGFRFEADREYGLVHFLTLVRADGHGRCAICYQERLTQTARRAAQSGADAFSSTLLASTRQDHDAIRAAGEQAANEAGIPFLYVDLRHLAAQGDALAKKMSLYRQQYCGCIFSEFERYKDTDVDIHRAIRQHSCHKN